MHHLETVVFLKEPWEILATSVVYNNQTYTQKKWYVDQL